MPNKIIKDGAIVDNRWQLVAKDAASVPTGPAILPYSLWLANKEQLPSDGTIGIWLDSDEQASLIADNLNSFALVAINFPAFADGRGFSYARELRETYNYQGELRAIGDFMRDQLYYLQRCGFNAFALQNSDLEAALSSLNDFSDAYQAAVDQPAPLFARR